MKWDCNMNFRKGNQPGSANEREMCMTECELVSEGSKRERQRDGWLRPVGGGDIIADSRQCESKAGVRTVSPLTPGGG